MPVGERASLIEAEAAACADIIACLGQAGLRPVAADDDTAERLSLQLVEAPGAPWGMMMMMMMMMVMTVMMMMMMMMMVDTDDDG